MIEVDPALRARLRAMRALGLRWWAHQAMVAPFVGTIIALANMVLGDIPADTAAVRGAGGAVMQTCMFAYGASLAAEEHEGADEQSRREGGAADMGRQGREA